MYFDKHCSVIVDVKLCDDVKCANGGTCKNTMSGFKCTCAFGYKGLKCEEGRFLTKKVLKYRRPLNIPNEVSIIPPIQYAIAGIMYNADWVVYNYFSRNSCVICICYIHPVALAS